MATQPHTEHDLDRTDELPRLDVAAYEAKLAAEADDTLGSTDAWSAETIYREPDATKRFDTAAVAKVPRARATQPDAPTAEVTLDATRILGRISQLESELGAAKTQQLELQARLDRVSNELSAKEREARALSADNARIQEQRALAMSRLESLEQQLKDETAQFERDITQQRQARASESSAAHQARTALEAQVAELTALTARLREDSLRLEDENHGAAKLAKTQSELIDHFKQRLQSEEKNAAQLARHLATKIAENASVNHEVERRNTTIRSLETTRDDLTQELNSLRDAHDDLQDDLEARLEELAAERAAVLDRDTQLAQRDERIAVLSAELSASQAANESLTQQRDQTAQALASERERHSQAQITLTTRAQQIDQLHASNDALQARVATLEQQLAAERAAHQEQQAKVRELENTLDENKLRRDMLTSEIESARAYTQQLESDVKQGLAVRESLNAKLEELQRIEAELKSARTDLEATRTTLAAKQAALDEREESVRSAHDIIANLRKINDELQDKVEADQSRLVELEANERTREESVLANAAELASVRRQLGQQIAAVQSMEQIVRARDTLTERLRGELQTSQDERGIIAGQLEKSRARNKSLAKELFARDAQIATLRADLAVHVETLAAIRQDVNRTASTTAELPVESGERILEPIDHAGDIILLNKKLMTIGRTSDNDICVPSKLVSRSHARLLIGPNAVILEDAGSTNGCFVNDVQVKQHLVREGDVLSIGDLKYRLAVRPDNSTRIRNNVIPFADSRRDEP